MRKLRKYAILGLVVMGFSSCKMEKLTPVYQPVTVNQLQNDQPIRFSYQVVDTQIDEYAKNAGKFPLFGKLFQAIAVVLANTSISSSGGQELKLEAVDVDLSTLSSKINFDLIQFIDFNSLIVSVRDVKSRDSLAFVDKLEVLMKLDSPVEGLPTDANGYSRIVYYDRSKDSLECSNHCIRLNIARVDWKKLLERNKLVRLQPKLVINSVPTSTMKLAGSIDFSIKFNLGF